MAWTDEQREEVVAMIHLGTWGSTTYPPKKWERWRWAEEGYAPEWLSFDDRGGADADECVTVLDHSLAQPEAPEGWRLVYQYQAGEHDCPDCHGRQMGDPEEYEGQPFEEDCTLCERTGVIYSGEECVVVVFAPILEEEENDTAN